MGPDVIAHQTVGVALLELFGLQAVKALSASTWRLKLGVNVGEHIVVFHASFLISLPTFDILCNP